MASLNRNFKLLCGDIVVVFQAVTWYVHKIEHMHDNAQCLTIEQFNNDARQ